MNIIKVPNVNVALHEGLWLLKTVGAQEESRNGPVLVAPGPVATIYTKPWQRVLFHPVRDANPVFHLIETIWMLAGRNDVTSLLPFNSNYSNYAEEDGVVWGAYGHRWRHHFGFDQLPHIIQQLRANKQDRRVVLSMWHAPYDLGTSVRDVPCNTHIYFRVNQGALDMTVCCRSNDVIWGAYGANVVHFSMLQELIAHACGLPVGQYIQFSNNYHVYIENEVAKRLLPVIENDPVDPYADGMEHLVIPMFQQGEDYRAFLQDCADLMAGKGSPGRDWRTAFFADVVWPLYNNYLARKDLKREFVTQPHSDWSTAFDEWCARRSEKETTNV